MCQLQRPCPEPGRKRPPEGQAPRGGTEGRPFVLPACRSGRRGGCGGSSSPKSRREVPHSWSSRGLREACAPLSRERGPFSSPIAAPGPWARTAAALGGAKVRPRSWHTTKRATSAPFEAGAPAPVRSNPTRAGAKGLWKEAEECPPGVERSLAKLGRRLCPVCRRRRGESGSPPRRRALSLPSLGLCPGSMGLFKMLRVSSLLTPIRAKSKKVRKHLEVEEYGFKKYIFFKSVLFSH